MSVNPLSTAMSPRPLPLPCSSDDEDVFEDTLEYQLPMIAPTLTTAATVTVAVASTETSATASPSSSSQSQSSLRSRSVHSRSAFAEERATFARELVGDADSRPPMRRQLTVEQIEQAELDHSYLSDATITDTHTSGAIDEAQHHERRAKLGFGSFLSKLFHPHDHSKTITITTANTTTSTVSDIGSGPAPATPPKPVSPSTSPIPNINSNEVSVNHRNSYSVSSSTAIQRQSIKVRSSHRDASLFSHVSLAQVVAEHVGPVWCLTVSADGHFVATAGQDSIVRIWVTMTAANQKLVEEIESRPADPTHRGPVTASGQCVLHPVPYRLFSGHKGDITSLSFAPSNFLLSSSIDRTVRLWHPSRTKCLTTFSHTDFVTGVKFHPHDERFFLSSSFDCKLRVWKITQHRVTDWVQTSAPVTSIDWDAHSLTIAAGLECGTVALFNSQLKYLTQLECRNHRGKYKDGCKVSGVSFHGERLLLVTTNDSRLRLFDWRDLRFCVKFKGFANKELQISARVSEDGSNITCGSEDGCCYAFEVPPIKNGISKLTSKPIKVSAYESFRGSDSAVTVVRAMPLTTINEIHQHRQSMSGGDRCEPASAIVLTATFTGEIRVFETTNRRSHQLLQLHTSPSPSEPATN